MSALTDYFKELVSEKKPENAPSMLAPTSVQAAYQSGMRTGAPTQPVTQQQIAQVVNPQVAQPPQSQNAGDAQYVQETIPNQMVFPEDVHNAQRQQGLQLKQAGISKINQLAQLLEPNERESFAKGLMAELDAGIAAKNIKTEDFIKYNPEIENQGKQYLNDNKTRDSIAANLAKQLEIIDAPVPKGKSPNNHAATIIRELQGTFLKKLNGIMGTSDAVAEKEADRLMGGATGKWADFSNFMKQGVGVFNPPEKQLQVYKKTLADVMHSLLSENNNAFNKLALESSPETAQKFLGSETVKPYSGKIVDGTPIGVTERISRQNAAIKDNVAPEKRAVRVRTFGPSGTLVDRP